jgi:Tfp pilus assembly protein PilF
LGSENKRIREPTNSQQHIKNLQFQLGLEQMQKNQEERQKQNLEGKLVEKDRQFLLKKT